MKGIVFTEFFEMVENSFGFDMVDSIIEKAKLPHNGMYVAGGTYPHEEMVQLVVALGNETQTPVPDLLKAYGKYLFHRLIALYPQLKQGNENPLQFIAQVENFIHVEVKKLYPDAELPKFTTIELSDNLLVLDYLSARKMQDFGVGLMEGCAEHYQQPLHIRYEAIENSEAVRFYISLA
jgi:hypothetical protein